MLTDEQRAEIAREAIRKAEVEAVKTSRDWKILFVDESKRELTRVGLRVAAAGEVFVEWPALADGSTYRKEIHDFIAGLMVERDEWRRRAEKHGCDVDHGDPDCG